MSCVLLLLCCPSPVGRPFAPPSHNTLYAATTPPKKLLLRAVLRAEPFYCAVRERNVRLHACHAVPGVRVTDRLLLGGQQELSVRNGKLQT